MWGLAVGSLSFHDLSADEVQVYVLGAVAVSCASAGVFLVLKRMTMLANSLSHTILIGIVLAYFLASLFAEKEGGYGGEIAPMELMLFGACLMGFFTVFLTQFLTTQVKLQEDASTGLVFTSLFALGVILVTILTRDSHIGTEAVMGNADALHISDLFWVYAILAFNLFLFTLFFKEYKLTAFDSSLALAMGFSPSFFNYLLMTQVSLTTITSFRAVGVLLVLAFMTGPPLAARLLTHRLKTLFFAAGFIGIFCALTGVAITRHVLTVYGIALSTSGVVVTTILAVYLFIAVFALLCKYIRRI